MHTAELAKLDVELNWHPCSQMKDYEQFPPLAVKSAHGSYLELADGSKIIDAISSWWCKSLGHNHPQLKQAMLTQLEQFEHVIFANTTNENIVKLSQRLLGLMPHLGKVFYAGDGSCAIEVALKMSVHARVIAGETKRTQFVALCNGYHGETTAALSVSDLGLYRAPYSSLLFEPTFIPPLYVTGESDPKWHDASEHWQQVRPQLEAVADSLTAIIVEPIVQGAGGMLIYSQDFLRRLAAWAKQHGIHLIADEIMTGLGRAGKMLACEHAGITPDFVCLSKGLTSGWLSFSAVMTTDEMYQLFYDDYSTGKSFLHSHTFCGNALGVAVALATLDVFEQHQIVAGVRPLQESMMQSMREIADETKMLSNIRGIGGVVAADLKADPSERKGFQLFQQAVKLGLLLRPLGNTIYWLPPLNIDADTVKRMAELTLIAIKRM